MIDESVSSCQTSHTSHLTWASPTTQYLFLLLLLLLLGESYIISTIWSHSIKLYNIILSVCIVNYGYMLNAFYLVVNIITMILSFASRNSVNRSLNCTF